jgi:hypothetical protein
MLIDCNFCWGIVCYEKFWEDNIVVIEKEYYARLISEFDSQLKHKASIVTN